MSYQFGKVQSLHDFVNKSGRKIRASADFSRIMHFYTTPALFQTILHTAKKRGMQKKVDLLVFTPTLEILYSKFFY